MNSVLLLTVVAATILAVIVPVLGIPALLGIMSVALYLRRHKRFEQNKLKDPPGEG